MFNYLFPVFFSEEQGLITKLECENGVTVDDAAALISGDSTAQPTQDDFDDDADDLLMEL